MNEDYARAFHVEGFRDHLALEAGNSGHTVENYRTSIASSSSRRAAGAERRP
jgi:hypothetical protein